MSTRVRFIDQDIHLPKKHFDAARDAVIALAKGKPKSKFGYVRGKNFLDAKTFEEVADGWGLEPEYDLDGNVHRLDFAGDNYLGREDLFLDAIAPFLREGDYIAVCAESEDRWRWIIRDGRCEEEWATHSYIKDVEDAVRKACSRPLGEWTPEESRYAVYAVSQVLSDIFPDMNVEMKIDETHESGLAIHMSLKE